MARKLIRKKAKPKLVSREFAQEFLRSKSWRDFKDILVRALNSECQICNQKRRLRIVHKFPLRHDFRSRYELSRMAIVCRKCSYSVEKDYSVIDIHNQKFKPKV